MIGDKWSSHETISRQTLRDSVSFLKRKRLDSVNMHKKLGLTKDCHQQSIAEIDVMINTVIMLLDGKLVEHGDHRGL